MANPTIISTNYNGTDSGAYISPVLLAGRTLGVPGVTIHNNVNYKTQITKIDIDNLIKGATCDFDPTGTVSHEGATLDVTALDVNMELCKYDLMQDFAGSDMGCKDPMPADYLNYIISQVGAKVADALEVMVWNGVGNADDFQGYATRLFHGSGVTGAISAGTVQPTAATIIADIRTLVAANPSADAIASQSDAFIYLSSANHLALRQANNDKGNAAPCGEDCIAVDGIKVFLAPGMKSDWMVYTTKANLHFGTWSSSDLQSVSVIDMSAWGEKNVRFAMCFFGGTAIGYGAEVSYWGTDPLL